MKVDSGSSRYCRTANESASGKTEQHNEAEDTDK
jgi:hypothetical protein